MKNYTNGVKNMKLYGLHKIGIVLLLILPFILSVDAIEIKKVEITPETLLPGDYADCKLLISSSKDEEIVSITFKAPEGITISPWIVTGIGKISSGSFYELPFTLKSTKAGRYSVEVSVSSKNGTIKQIFNVIVENNFPSIVLKKSGLVLKEVNQVEFTIASPVDARRITVEPLFKSEPKLIYFDSAESAEGVFKVYPEEKKELEFKISFYNGRNYHEIIRKIMPDYSDSKGVFLTANSTYSIVPVNDVTIINVGVTNLRNDNIYGLVVKLETPSGSSSEILSEEQKEYPFLKPMESVKFSFMFSPEKAGNNVIKVTVMFKDEMGNDYYLQRDIQISAIDKDVISVSNIEVERNLNEIKITGDLSNSGWGNTRDVMLEMSIGNITKNFFVGEIESGDFYSFEFVFPRQPGAAPAQLKVSWVNELGRTVELHKEIEMPEIKKIEPSAGNSLLYAGIAGILIVIIVIAAWLKSRK